MDRPLCTYVSFHWQHLHYTGPEGNGNIILVESTYFTTCCVHVCDRANKRCTICPPPPPSPREYLVVGSEMKTEMDRKPKTEPNRTGPNRTESWSFGSVRSNTCSVRFGSVYQILEPKTEIEPIILPSKCLFLHRICYNFAYFSLILQRFSIN